MDASLVLVESLPLLGLYVILIEELHPHRIMLVFFPLGNFMNLGGVQEHLFLIFL